MEKLYGLQNVLNTSAGDLHVDEVTDDVDAEIESMQAAADFDEALEKDPAYLRPPSETLSVKKQKVEYSDLEKHIEKASENVVVPGTLHEYRKYVYYSLSASDTSEITLATQKLVDSVRQVLHGVRVHA